MLTSPTFGPLTPLPQPLSAARTPSALTDSHPGSGTRRSSGERGTLPPESRSVPTRNCSRRVCGLRRCARVSLYVCVFRSRLLEEILSFFFFSSLFILVGGASEVPSCSITLETRQTSPQLDGESGQRTLPNNLHTSITPCVFSKDFCSEQLILTLETLVVFYSPSPASHPSPPPTGAG